MTRIHQDVRLIEQMETLFLAGSLGGLTDGALLDRFQSREASGSEAAFAELVKRHGPMVLGACRRILADPHLAEDALQATFLVLARRAGSVRNRETLGGWLHRVACRIAWRSRKRSDRRRAKEEPMVEEIAAKPVDRAEDAELRLIVDQEIDRLRDVQRLPVVLCCLQGLSHEEASERLRWPLGTVKSRLARGRETLQGRLIRRGVSPALASAALTAGTPGAEAAALSSALVKSTAALAMKAGVAGAGASAAVSALVSEELGSVLAFKAKVGAVLMVSGLLVVTAGSFAPAISGRGPGGDEVPKPAVTQKKAPKPETPPIVAKLSASGRVVDASGNPIAGAKVFVREWSARRTFKMADSEFRKLRRGESVLDDVLADTTTDAEGRFRFEDVSAPAIPYMPAAGKVIFPWDLVALGREHGLAWVRLTRQNQSVPITLTLGDEGIVRGKLVEPNGKPVPGAKVRVFAIVEPDQVKSEGLPAEDCLDLRWSDFLVVTTDEDGRFIIRSLPKGKVAMLVVSGRRHERLTAYAAAEAPGEIDPKRIPDVFENGAKTILHGELLLTTRVADHVLRGRVVFEADHKPAPKATFILGGYAEELDAEGRFRLDGLVAGKLVLRAIDRLSDAAPAEVEVVIPETPKETEYTLVLPRGLVVQGRVIDGSNGKGVGNVKVRYAADPTTTTRFGFVCETDAAGRYRFVLPAVRGYVEVMEAPAEFLRAERHYTGEPPGASYSRQVDGQAGQTIELVDISLRPAGESSIRVVGQDGRPVFRAEARLLYPEPDPPPGPVPGLTDAEGRYRVPIRNPHQIFAVDVTSPERMEGASVGIPGPDSPGKKQGEIEVRLRPVGRLSGRVLDENGDPLPGSVLILYRNVRYPDRAGTSFGKPVDTGGEVARDGGFSFKGLVPDATYSVHVEVGGHATATSQHVKIRSGEETRLEDFRLPATDQELSGVVVDPRGRPIAGASISYQHDGRDQALYAPDGAVWFQDTDASGRFHLRGLLRGAKRLMAYRNEGAERNIRNLEYADVAADQKEVRIEVPDINERLRGIE